MTETEAMFQKTWWVLRDQRVPKDSLEWQMNARMLDFVAQEIGDFRFGKPCKIFDIPVRVIPELADCYAYLRQRK